MQNAIPISFFFLKAGDINSLNLLGRINTIFFFSGGVMADPGDLKNNPFTALFPSLGVAEQYSIENNRLYEENKQSGIDTVA